MTIITTDNSFSFPLCNSRLNNMGVGEEHRPMVG